MTQSTNTADQLLLKAEYLNKKFSISTGRGFKKLSYYAVRDLSLEIKKGEIFGLVGESGCGKSTLGSMLLGLQKPDSGSILFEGKDLTNLSSSKLKELRKDIQTVFQDPYDSLDPRFTIRQIMEEPLIIQGIGPAEKRTEIILSLLDRVDIPSDFLSRYPHQLSGGQRQRLCIARALTLSPRFLILDEAVSALDVSVQAQVINLLLDLKEQLELTYLFISHDLSIVKFMSDRIAVMYFGRIVELADKHELSRNIRHPYTKALFLAMPEPDPDIPVEVNHIEAGVPSLINPPGGCAFHPRCPYATDRCRKEAPELREISEGHLVACHLACEPIS
ncbi:MAG: ATP-binding cassette domain-containing protein [Clostridia bacterium]|nr:ATP-binding cassette domain-containing protein [Clostridia bacterium]